jgi:hypothetical protein
MAVASHHPMGVDSTAAVALAASAHPMEKTAAVAVAASAHPMEALFQVHPMVALDLGRDPMDFQVAAAISAALDTAQAGVGGGDPTMDAMGEWVRRVGSMPWQSVYLSSGNFRYFSCGMVSTYS